MGRRPGVQVDVTLVERRGVAKAGLNMAAAPKLTVAAESLAPVALDRAEGARLKLVALRDALSAGLIERDEEAALAVLSLVAGEHLLLVGPPGVAKSLLVDGLMSGIDGDSFGILLTKFTEPNELLGPIDLAAYQEGRYGRVTAGHLPAAHVAFLDEVFKGSSAALNVMLRLLNEGVYWSGSAWIKAPLRMAVGASNEWPDPDNGGAELAAFFDRFLVRKRVYPVRSAGGQDRLLFGGDVGIRPLSKLSIAEIDLARASAAAVPYSDAARDAVVEVIRALGQEGIQPSDRRKRKSVGLARAAAWLSGSTQVEPDHLECLAHTLWDDPVSHPAKTIEVVTARVNPLGYRIGALLSEADQVVEATDVTNLNSAAVSVAKLTEIGKQLKAIGSDRRVNAAVAQVKALTDDIHRRAMPKFD